jgi:hypothetical protein
MLVHANRAARAGSEHPKFGCVRQLLAGKTAHVQ